jgi:hypothetical protein
MALKQDEQLSMSPTFKDCTSTTIASIVPGRSDAEVAVDLRKRLEAALGNVVSIMDDANESGLQVSFQLGRDSYGKNRINELGIVRPL